MLISIPRYFISVTLLAAVFQTLNASVALASSLGTLVSGVSEYTRKSFSAVHATASDSSIGQVLKHNTREIDPSDFSYIVTRGTTDSSDPVPYPGDRKVDAHGFRFFCVPTHFSYNDPLVFPGVEGRAHLHMFYGNAGINHESTRESIINSGASSCDGGITNRSGYWIPALFNEAGNPVLPNSILLYYKSWIADRDQLRPVPVGLEILANDQVPGINRGVIVGRSSNTNFDGALLLINDGVHGHVPDDVTDGVVTTVNFPECVAVHPTLDSDADGMNDPILTQRKYQALYPNARYDSHVMYSGGGCPASHPYTIPQLTQNVIYANVPFDSDWYLASDFDHDGNSLPKGSTLHADYMAAWSVEAAQTMIDCIRDNFKECGPGLQGEWEDTFFAPDGTQVYDFFRLAEGVDMTPNFMNGWPPSLHMANATVSTSIPDSTPTDFDNEDVVDTSDNCPDSWNSDQADNDGYETGNVCDSAPNGVPVPNTARTVAFNAVDRIEATENVNIREPADSSRTVLGRQSASSDETDLSLAPVTSDSYEWIAVDFDSGVDGWVSADNLTTLVSSTMPALSGDGAELMIFANWPPYKGDSGYEAALHDHRATSEALLAYLNSNRRLRQPPMYMIPSYQLMLAIKDDIDTGTAPGLSGFGGLFRDELHLSAIADYAVASLVYAVVFGQHPNNLPVEYNPEWHPVTGEQAAYLKNVAWEVANKYAFTGLGERTPSAITAPIVHSGNSQTHGWFSFMLDSALPPNHQSDISIRFGSTVEERWNLSETEGVQLPEAIGNYELVVVGLGPYLSGDITTAVGETGFALKLFADAAWFEGSGSTTDGGPVRTLSQSNHSIQVTE